MTKRWNWPVCPRHWTHDFQQLRNIQTALLPHSPLPARNSQTTSPAVFSHTTMYHVIRRLSRSKSTPNFYLSKYKKRSLQCFNSVCWTTGTAFCRLWNFFLISNKSQRATCATNMPRIRYIKHIKSLNSKNTDKKYDIKYIGILNTQYNKSV